MSADPEAETPGSPVEQHGRRSKPARRYAWIAVALIGIVALGTVLVGGPVPELISALSRRALLQADFTRAERYIDLGRRLSPQNAELEFLDARLRRHLGQADRSLELLRRAKSHGFSSDRVDTEKILIRSTAGDTSALEQRLPQLLVAGVDLDEICEALVLGYLISYRLDDAETVLQVWLQDFPEDPKALFLLGRLLEHREDLPGAAQQYRLAAEQGHGPAAFALGGVLRQRQQIDKALPFAVLATEQLYDPQPGLVLQARLHRLENRLQQADECLDQAAKSDPQRALTAWVIAGIPASDALSQVEAERGELALAREDFAAAETSFREALKKTPQRWRLQHRISEALRLQGKVAEATEHLERYQEIIDALEDCGKMVDRLRSHPEDIEARLAVARTLMENVSPEQGRTWLESVLFYDPENQEALRELYEFYRDHASEHPEYAKLAEQHLSQLKAVQK